VTLKQHIEALARKGYLTFETKGRGKPPVRKSFEQTYQPVLHLNGWKVATLRHFDVVDVATLYRVERHRNTDEVFVLVEGDADLIFCSGDIPEKAYVLTLERAVAFNVHNVPVNTRHHVVMSQDAHIVLFERSETGAETTDYAPLSPSLLAEINPNLTLKGTR